MVHLAVVGLSCLLVTAIPADAKCTNEVVSSSDGTAAAESSSAASAETRVRLGNDQVLLVDVSNRRGQKYVVELPQSPMHGSTWAVLEMQQKKSSTGIWHGAGVPNFAVSLASCSLTGFRWNNRTIELVNITGCSELQIELPAGSTYAPADQLHLQVSLLTADAACLQENNAACFSLKQQQQQEWCFLVRKVDKVCRHANLDNCPAIVNFAWTFRSDRDWQRLAEFVLSREEFRSSGPLLLGLRYQNGRLEYPAAAADGLQPGTTWKPVYGRLAVTGTDSCSDCKFVVLVVDPSRGNPRLQLVDTKAAAGHSVLLSPRTSAGAFLVAKVAFKLLIFSTACAFAVTCFGAFFA